MACRQRTTCLFGQGPKLLQKQQFRCLTLHASDSQRLLHENNVPIFRGQTAKTPSEAMAVAQAMPSRVVRISPQVVFPFHGHTLRSESGLNINMLEGGRQASDVTAIGNIAKKMLGWKASVPVANMGHDERLIESVYITEMRPPEGDIWNFSINIDREKCTPVLLVYGRRLKDPDSDQRLTECNRAYYEIKYSEGIPRKMLQEITKYTGYEGKEARQLRDILSTMWNLFVEKDLAKTRIMLRRKRKGIPGLAVFNSVMTIDDAAAKRQETLFRLRDLSQENAASVEAEQSGLVYIKMDGNIGNVVNGAGLAMATNDAIDYYGGKSANFLDAGGQATKETMVRAFDIVLRDERVKTIIVNVYGGITNCAMIAESIIAATKELGPIKVPIVVRLQGTNSEDGLKLLEEADLGLYVEADFGAAAAKAVELAGPYEASTGPSFSREQSLAWDGEWLKAPLEEGEDIVTK